MARRKRFDLSLLESVREDLRLPRLLLDPPRMEGYAYRYKIVLPLLSAAGEEVFTVHHLAILFDLFERRCGGSLASSGVAHPAWYGSYRPGPGVLPVKDYHTVIYVYTRPIDAADLSGRWQAGRSTAILARKGQGPRNQALERFCP